MSIPIIEAIEARARRRTTACGDGELVWRQWGRGPSVVLLHGGFGSWLHWIRNIDALSARFSVRAVDLPGLGDSSLPSEPPSPSSIARPIVDGLCSMLADDERCDLVGFSFGGLIAGQVAATLGSRVRGLTLVGSSGLGLPRERVELVRRTPDMDTAALRAAQAHNVRTLMVFDPANADALALHIQDHNDARARVKSRSMSLGASLRDVLPSVTAPVNAIWGEHDVTAVPRLEARRELLRQLVPELDFRVIPNAGHWVQYEASEPFNAMLLEMLQPEPAVD